MTEDEPSLPANRAFVVQFRFDADIGQERLEGRVEHLVSGQAIHFDSLEELFEFFARTLPKRSGDHNDHAQQETRKRRQSEP